jgi:hypothetical protein
MLLNISQRAPLLKDGSFHDMHPFMLLCIDQNTANESRSRQMCSCIVKIPYIEFDFDTESKAAIAISSDKKKSI